MISAKLVYKWPNQHKLRCLKISSPYPEAFSFLHPLVKGIPEKTISTPNSLDFPKTTSPRSKILWQSKLQLRMNPITPWLSMKWQDKDETTTNQGKSQGNDKKWSCKPNACTMHSNPIKEMTRATDYLQNLPVVVSLPIFSFCSLVFICLLLASYPSFASFYCPFLVLSFLSELSLWNLSKDKIHKRCELFLWCLFIIDV